MSDIDPQPANDSSPEPLAGNDNQHPGPEAPCGESTTSEAAAGAPVPETPSSEVSAEVDAMLAGQVAPTGSEAESPATGSDLTPTSVDASAILDAALGAMNAADNLVELAPGARTTGSVRSINLDRKEAVVELSLIHI